MYYRSPSETRALQRQSLPQGAHRLKSGLGGETEAWRRHMTRPRLLSMSVAETGIEPRCLDSHASVLRPQRLPFVTSPCRRPELVPCPELSRASITPKDTRTKQVAATAVNLTSWAACEQLPLTLPSVHPALSLPICCEQRAENFNPSQPSTVQENRQPPPQPLEVPQGQAQRPAASSMG